MTDTTPTDVVIPLDVARHVLWHFGDLGLGQDAGGFTTLLMRAWQHGDSANRARLALAFPELCAAMDAVANHHWGLEWLRKRVMDAAVSA